jgi:pyruvate-formate lyase-activating enzyme
MAKSYVSTITKNIGQGEETARHLLYFELTERCNNNCVHCCINRPAGDREAMAAELTTEELLDLFQQAADLNYLSVKFTGGEPLLRPDFSQLYLAARRMGLRVMFFTNGALLTPKIADMFAAVTPGELIEITLYGLSEDSYESAGRVPGNFTAAWRGIQLLQEREVPFIVKGTILPGNRQEIDDFIAWTKSNPWMEGRCEFVSDFLLRCRRDDPDKNALIRSLRLPWQESWQLLGRDLSAFVADSQDFATRLMRPWGDRLFLCSPGGGVDARGFFNVCTYLKYSPLCYDLRQRSLREAITDFCPEILALRNSNPEYLERCARCFLNGGFCDQCPGRAWLETGAPDNPCEHYCEVAHDQARYLGLLGPQEKAWLVTDWESRLKDFCGELWRDTHPGPSPDPRPEQSPTPSPADSTP